MDALGIGMMGAGLLGTILGGNSSRKQYQAMLERQMAVLNNNMNRQVQLAQPYYQAGLQGLQQTQSFTNDMNAERFKENEYLNEARRTSLQEANRITAQGRKNASYAFGNNQGRARGEMSREGRKGVLMKNNINLNWANQQNSERMKNTQLYLNGVSMLNQAGYTGTNMMSNAYNNYAQGMTSIIGQTPINSTMENIGGSLLGLGQNIFMMDRYKGMLN